MPVYRLTLTDDQGILLDAWHIDPVGDSGDQSACNTRKAVARSFLMDEIHDAVETAQASRDAGR